MEIEKHQAIVQKHKTLAQFQQVKQQERKKEKKIQEIKEKKQHLGSSSKSFYEKVGK